jgi:uncharacterized membrane protein YdjX (TVP38/TMEM64 family)
MSEDQKLKDTENTDDVGKVSMRGLVVFLAFAVAALVVSVFTPAGDYLTKERISSLVSSVGVWGPLVILLIGLAGPFVFMPRWPLAWASGLLYGIFWGTLLADVASTLGSLIHYYLARTTLAPAAQKVLKKFGLHEGQLNAKRKFYLCFFLRVFPLGSYVGNNLLGGALRLPLRTYLTVAFIGMIPSTVMYASWGKLMKERTSSHSLTAGLSVVFILLLCVIAHKKFVPWLKKIRAEGPEQDDHDKG